MTTIGQTIVMTPGDCVTLKLPDGKILAVHVETVANGGRPGLIYDNGNNEEFGYDLKKKLVKYDLD